MQFLEEQDFLAGRVEVSRVGGWCSVMNVGRPVAWILLVMMCLIHAAMYLSYCTHVEMVS